MFPISISQIKLINFIKFYKIVIWFFLRHFQLNNEVVFDSIYKISKNKNTDFDKNLQYLKPANKPTKTTLILFENFSYKMFFKHLRFVRNMRIIDKSYLLTSEASTRFRLMFYDLSSDSEKQEFFLSSYRNFHKFCEKYGSNNIGILGTGPSFDEGKEYFIDKKINVLTCNSAIYDDDIWKTNNFILCFADPVFHFGISSEAQRFRREVVSKFNKSKFYIIVPIEAYPLLSNEWKIDSNYIIGLNPKNGNLQYPLINSNLGIKRTSNIMTEFMLPVASKISNKIETAGFDGRKKEEKNFWQYSNKTDQSLDEHKLDHPSFFEDRNIKKYYRKHLKILSKQVRILEENEYTISNITTSNITFLNKRTNV